MPLMIHFIFNVCKTEKEILFNQNLILARKKSLRRYIKGTVFINETVDCELLNLPPPTPQFCF